MTSLKLIQLNFSTGGYNLLARVILNGKPALFMVDTSSAKTVLDTDHMQKFVGKAELKRNTRQNLAPGSSSVYSYVANIEKMEIGSLVIRNYKATSVDLSHINRAFRGMGNPQVDGLLGCDLLKHCKATINFEDRVLELGLLEEPEEPAKNEVIE
ncbi:MAG: aspartyl protease family protein [Lentimicrobium sp.]|nr:aspartyl protease family protein [Lentimicrobium sp.]